MLCPQCLELRLVRDIHEGVLALDCGHQRGQILPSTAGLVSFELFMSQKKADRELASQIFPAGREGEMASQKDKEDHNIA